MHVTTIKFKREFQTILLDGLGISLIILLSAFMNNLIGQSQLGFRGGVHISEPGLSTSIGNSAGLTKAYTGVDLALLADFKLRNKLSLQSELAYTEKGIRLGTATNLSALGTAIPLGVQTITKIRMLEMPVMAKYRLGAGPIKAYLAAGPTVSYAINGNFKTQGTLLTQIDLVNENFDLGNQNRFGIGFVSGAGIEFDQGPGSVFLDVRYTHQTLKMKNLPLANVNFNNNGVGFNIGYKFDI